MQKDFENLINKDKFQVFLFSSKANFPFLFAIHPWFVINKRGDVSRWEVAHSRKFKSEKSWGHLYKNLFSLFQGINTIIFFKRPINKSKLIGKIEDEVAKRMIDFIEELPNNYKYLNKYKLLGPNSNTFAEYIINKFPESNLKLPWNAFGKNYE